MTGAELDTKRVSLGLSVPELGRLCGVTERTARYWMVTDSRPDDVAERLDALEIAMGDMVDAQAEMVDERFGSATVPLTRYRTQEALDASPHAGLPLGAHAMMISWLADDLRERGHRVTIAWGREAGRC